MTEPIMCDRCHVEMIDVDSPSNRVNLIVDTSTTTAPSVEVAAALSGSRKIEKILSMICPVCKEKKQVIRWAR